MRDRLFWRWAIILARVLSICLAFGLGTLLVQAADQPAPGENASGATIKGVVRYQADPAQPWRLSRYYVKDSQKGWLAEAVVALSGANLPTAGRAPITNHVDQSNFMFVPETVAIRAGDSVKFTNSDDSLHNVMTNDGEAPFNENMAKGEEFFHTFKTAGGLAKPVRLGCVYHGGMRGWVYVFDHPFYQMTGAEGAFEFGKLPPGEYTLEVVHPAGRLKSKQTVKVQAGQTVIVEVPVKHEPAR